MTIIFFSGNLHKAREIEAIFAPFRVRIYTDFMKPFEVVECGKSFSENAKIKLNALKSAIELQGFKNIFKGEVEQKDCILMAEDSGICVESLDNFPHIFSARFANLPPLASLRDISKIAPHPVIARRSRSNPNKMDCHDSTLCVESWQSAKDSTDSENVARLIRELKAKGFSESNAQFISCVACCKFDSKDSLFKNQSARSANPIKSFCYFWLSPKVESPLPLNLNPPSNAQILTTHGFLNGKVITQIKGANGFGYDPIFVPNGFESTLAEMPSIAKNALSHRKIALDLMRLILCPLSAKNLF